ncbi:MAG TPA: hypothetical protein VFH91_05505 [Pyrinomonadaceae bacterium]|nr:hypothetical protein [Pyrinomonadaceae bacterium]
MKIAPVVKSVFYRIASDIRDLVLNENLQNEQNSRSPLGTGLK